MAETTIDFGYKPRKWQAECHADQARFRVYALHRRAGKTMMAVMELIGGALRCNAELGLYVFIAPFLSQAKNIAWGLIKYKLKDAIASCLVHINEAELTVTFNNNGAKLKLYGADNFDALRGVRIDGCVLDEVGQIKPELWQDVVQPALSDRKGWSIFIGTPSGVNMFSELFYKAKELPNWSSKLFTVYDTEAIDPEEVERLRRDMAESSFRREYLCDFAAAGEDQLIPLGLIEESCQKIHKIGAFDFAPKIIGVDPARFGDDSSVIQRRQGLMMFDPIAFHGLDNMELANHVAGLIVQWNPDAVFVDAGNGSGVIDRLRQLGHDIIEIPFGGKPINAKYANKRAEMWDELKEWLKLGGQIPNNMRLKQDLGTPRFWFDKTGRLILEPKDDIKKRGLPSPDYGDAAVLTFAAPVVARHDIKRDKKGGFTSDYDPLADKHILQN